MTRIILSATIVFAGMVYRLVKSWSAVVLFVLLVHGRHTERTSGNVPFQLGISIFLSSVKPERSKVAQNHTVESDILGHTQSLVYKTAPPESKSIQAPPFVSATPHP